MISIKVARKIAALWAVCLLVLIASGVATAFFSVYRGRISTAQPTMENNAGYVDHARVYFAPKSVLEWHARCDQTFRLSLGTFAILTAVGMVVAHFSGVIGLRWRQIKKQGPP